MSYFLGVDLGATKSHTVIADGQGKVLGFGLAGPGNHEIIGYHGMLETLKDGLCQALTAADLTTADISAAGFGIAGFDWPSQKPAMLQTISQLDLTCPLSLVNDSIPPILGGAADGWGISLIAGTGCNCRGWDKKRQREGRITGHSARMGEFAGASELVWRALRLIAYEWTKRGQPTAISTAFINYAGAKDLSDFIEGINLGLYHVDPAAAPLIFEAAKAGDPVAQRLIHWAGVELGELAKAVIRQLEFEKVTFDVVLSGSLFKGGSILIDPMWQTITDFAPQARLVHLTAPPVIGAVLLGMDLLSLEQLGPIGTAETRQNLIDSLKQYQSTTSSP